MTTPNAALRELAADAAFRREIAIGRTDAALAQVVGERMAEAGVTRAGLAERLGLGDDDLARAFDAGCEMSVAMLVAILWELGVDLSGRIEELGHRG